MTFKNFLNQRRNIVIIWIFIHCIALFVNIFNIQGKIKEGYSESLMTNQGQIRFKPNSINAFTDNFKYDEETKATNFWPFSLASTYSKPFDGYLYYKKSFFKTYDSDNNIAYIFHGVFNDYDYSEFIAYNLIFFIILYFKWDKQQRKT